MRDSERSGGIGAALIDEFVQAIGDIRSKLIDEGWFGRRAPEPMRDIPVQDNEVWFGREGPTVLDGLPDAFFVSTPFEEQWAVRDGDVGREPSGHDHER